MAFFEAGAAALPLVPNDAEGRQRALVNRSDAWEPCHYETR